MARFPRPGWRAIAGLLGSAALFGLYARGGNAYVLGFVALVPWLLVLDGARGAGAALRGGWAMSVLFAVAVFAWFGFGVASYIGAPPVAGVLALLLAAPLLQPQFLAFALARHLAGRRHGPLVRALAGASAWVAAEWLVPRLLEDTLGHGLFPSYVLRQGADLGGATGLTFLLVLVNEAVAMAIVRRRDGARAWAAPLATGAAVVVLLAGYGALRLSLLAPAADGPTLRVGLVQSNIVDYERLRREMGAYDVVRLVLDTHYAMSREAVDRHRVDALLWSETVYPTTFGTPKSEAGAELDRELQGFVDGAGVPLVFGTYDVDAAGEYNAAAFVAPRTGTVGLYRKSRPFPLTEYVPAWLDGPVFRRWLPWTGGWRPGDGARVFPLRLADGREIPALPMICLDDVDAGLAIDGARLGARVILGMSNDSWFTQHPVGARLHQTVAAFRSIETRLPQLRVTSNGYSAAIDATGTITAITAMDERRLLVGDVATPEPPRTLMVAWGDWVGRVALAWLVLLAVLATARARRPRTVAAVALADTDAPIEAMLLSPGARAAMSALQLAAAAGLLWMGAMLLRDGMRVGSLSQIAMFAAVVLAPALAAWALGRACAARVRIHAGVLVIDQRQRRIEIDAVRVVAVAPWRWPLPDTGAWLHLGSQAGPDTPPARRDAGRRWSHGIAGIDPAALAAALAATGAPLPPAAGMRMPAYARARHALARSRFDHPLLKFVLFPLVPALPAFRLHQHIAFGGTFGEYHTYGLKAYLLALLIWWASWAMGMIGLAAVLRTGIEAGTASAALLRPTRAIDARRVLEHLGRLLYYVGVPAWLVLRIVSG